MKITLLPQPEIFTNPQRDSIHIRIRDQLRTWDSIAQLAVVAIIGMLPASGRPQLRICFAVLEKLLLYELRLIEEQLVQLGILETGTLLIPGENEVWDQED